jgi:hypothetical protein
MNFQHKIEKYIKVYGLIMYPLYMFLMAYTWMRAYFSNYNGIPHTMLFSVDFVGEASIEFVLLFILLPVSVWVSFVFLKDLLRSP